LINDNQIYLNKQRYDINLDFLKVLMLVRVHLQLLY